MRSLVIVLLFSLVLVSEADAKARDQSRPMSFDEVNALLLHHLSIKITEHTYRNAFKSTTADGNYYTVDYSLGPFQESPFLCRRLAFTLKVQGDGELAQVTNLFKGYEIKKGTCDQKAPWISIGETYVNDPMIIHLMDSFEKWYMDHAESVKLPKGQQNDRLPPLEQLSSIKVSPQDPPLVKINLMEGLNIYSLVFLFRVQMN